MEVSSYLLPFAYNQVQSLAGTQNWIFWLETQILPEACKSASSLTDAG